MTAYASTSLPREVATTGAPVPPQDLDETLADLEAARASQLASIPTSNLDPVTAAYRASVERILDEIRTARRRLAAGMYGVCARCGATIPAARLELRVWATNCTGCDQQRR